MMDDDSISRELLGADTLVPEFSIRWLTDISSLLILILTREVTLITISSVFSSLDLGMPLISRQSQQEYCSSSSMADFKLAHVFERFDTSDLSL